MLNSITISIRPRGHGTVFVLHLHGNEHELCFLINIRLLVQAIEAMLIPSAANNCICSDHTFENV